MSRGGAARADAAAERALLEPEDGAFDRLGVEPSSAASHLAHLAAARGRGRLPHALLLTGPRGSGKRWCAVRLAQLLACERVGAGADAADRPCLACIACQRTERGDDPDVLILEPPWDDKKGEAKGEIPVEQVRRLQDKLSFRPSGTRRFVVIDPADRLSHVAQEAVLKTLEEPPAQVTIALLTTRASYLKPTVRSRSQIVRFASPSPSAIAAFLVASGGIDSAKADVAAHLSGGDARRAQALDPEEEGERWIGLARKLYELLGPKGERRARDLAVEVAGLREAAAGRDELAAWLALLEAILRDAMIAGASGDGAAPVLGNPAAVKAATSLATRIVPEAAAEALAAIASARDDLALNMSAKLVLTGLLLTIHGLRR